MTSFFCNDALFERGVRILSALPLPIRRVLGRFGGAIFGLIPTREQRSVRLQAAAFLKTVPRFFPTRVFAHIGEVFMESLCVSDVVKETRNQPTNHEMTHAIEQTALSGRPRIFLSAHFGNWELLGARFSFLLPDFLVPAREVHNPAAQKLLQTMREKNNVPIIWRSDRKGIAAMVDTLKRNGALAVLIDQDTKVSSAFTPFFGVEASTPSTIVDMGVKYGADFYASFLVKTKKALRKPEYTLVFQCLSSATEVPRTSDDVLLAYNTFLAESIRKYPEQWVWFHHRWRTRPQGRLSFKEYCEQLSAWA
jgi:Kdo2-lipid IVA lauroyltransferase/acyltransferase